MEYEWGNGGFEELKAKKYSRFYDFSIENEEFQNIKFQYKALGLIMKSVRNHSVKDIMNYWTLTEYEDYVMTQLIAIKKSGICTTKAKA